MSRQEGSTHVIVVMSLVILLIGALGFIFWQNFLAEKPVQENAEISQKSDGPKDETTDAPREAESWTKFDGEGFSFRIPDGWNLTLNTDSGILFYGEKGDSLDYSKGKAAVIDRVSLPGSGVPPGFIVKTELSGPGAFDKATSFQSHFEVKVERAVTSEDYYGTEYDRYLYRFTVPGQALPMEVSYEVEEGATNYSKQLELGLMELKID